MTFPREHRAPIPADRQFQPRVQPRATWQCACWTGLLPAARTCSGIADWSRVATATARGGAGCDAGQVDIPAAGAIVFDNASRLLLVRRLRPPGAGLWSVPGGKCLPRESSTDACVRECLEETGLRVAVLRSAGRVHLPAPDGNRFAVEDFLCTVTGGTPRAGDDAGELCWATRADLARLPLVAGLLDTLTGWGLLPGGAT